MIDIDQAIYRSKSKDNISDGGSACYDFGDVVLVKYTMPLEYATPEHRARGNQEAVMRGINEKSAKGVNTPKHISMKRVVEGEYDVCYVLQEKCKGRNLSSMYVAVDSPDRLISGLNYALRIPFEQYEKLVYDNCMLYEMGYEPKPKNMFYDEETGFWYIDFLENKEDDRFDFNDPIKIFEVIYSTHSPSAIAGYKPYDAKWSETDEKKVLELNYGIYGKLFLAYKRVIPKFEKYEKFYLFNRDDDYKKYLMDEGIVQCNLFEVTDEDIQTYNELCEIVVNKISSKIIKGTYIINNRESMKEYYKDNPEGLEIESIGRMYYDVEKNEIRNNSELFHLQEFFARYINKDFKEEDFECNDDYVRETLYKDAIEKAFTKNMMEAIYEKVSSAKPSEYTDAFMRKYEEENYTNNYPNRVL